MKIKYILGSKNPFQKPKCIHTDSRHVQVSSEEVKIPCNNNNIGPRWRYIICKERNIVKLYEGEAGRSARTRGSEHLKEL